MVFRMLPMLCLFAHVAAADTAYVVRTAEGIFLNEFSPQPNACGPKTRNELEGLLVSLPVVTVTDTAMLFTTVKVDSASKTFRAGVDAIGTWNFGSKVLTISVRHWGNGDHGPKVLDVEITRAKNDAGIARPGGCKELWEAIVSPTRTRETLRGN